MDDNTRNHNKDWASIMSAMAEHTLDITDEELFDEIRAEGEDPDQSSEHVRDVLLRAVKSYQQKTSVSDGEIKDGAAGEGDSLPLLGVWKKYTNLKPRAIAKAIGVTVTFLSDINRHAKTVPRRWLTALATLGKQALGIPEQITLQALGQPFQYERAASRDDAYEKCTVSCEEILDRSGMDEKERQYWRDMLEEE